MKRLLLLFALLTSTLSPARSEETPPDRLPTLVRIARTIPAGKVFTNDDITPEWRAKNPVSVVGSENAASSYWVLTVFAPDKYARTRLQQLLGADIHVDSENPEHAHLVATDSEIQRLQAEGFPILKRMRMDRYYQTVIAPQHETPFAPQDFPPDQRAYHNFERMQQAFFSLQGQHPDLISLVSLGNAAGKNPGEGRPLWALRFNTTAKEDQPSEKPGIAFFFTYHAREHLGTEMGILLAQYLASRSRTDSRVRNLLQTRDIWILTMVNPDSVERDIADWHRSGRPGWVRKNPNGVDLNRHHDAPDWGKSPGSSGDPNDETYRGEKPDTEPEAIAVRDFFRAHSNIHIGFSGHTFSKLILWPPGYTYDPLPDPTDRAVYETMGRLLSRHNRYKPQQSSDLYITNGDFDDAFYFWSKKEQEQGRRKWPIFTLTFEFDPGSAWGGGFYPGPQLIQPTFDKNIGAFLDLMEWAENPYQVLQFNGSN